MSANKTITFPMVLCLILLAALLYAFRLPLFAAGIRAYTTVSHDPRSERLLGDYYAHHAVLNTELANQFYTEALNKYQTLVTKHTVSLKDQATIKLAVGKMYECGKGAPANLATAKMWYAGALEASKEAKKQNQFLTETVTAEIQQAFDRTKHQGNPTDTAAVCEAHKETQFLLETFKSHGH